MWNTSSLVDCSRWIFSTDEPCWCLPCTVFANHPSPRPYDCGPCTAFMLQFLFGIPRAWLCLCVNGRSSALLVAEGLQLILLASASSSSLWVRYHHMIDVTVIVILVVTFFTSLWAIKKDAMARHNTEELTQPRGGGGARAVPCHGAAT